jgi:hypothetical protein
MLLVMCLLLVDLRLHDQRHGRDVLRDGGEAADQQA